MPIAIDYQMVVYVVLVVVLAIAAFSLKKGALIFTVPFRMAIAAVLIVLFNISIGKYLHISIPLNIATAFLAGVLELPGVVLIFIIKYTIFPM